MDHTDRLRQNLELLGLEHLRDISLMQLLDRIDKNFPSEISEKRLLHIFVAWLNERLLVIDTSDEGAFSQEIKSWCYFLRMCSYDDDAVGDSFKDWQSEQLVIEPASSRRLYLAELEIASIFGRPLGRQPLSKITAEKESHTDRAVLDALRPAYTHMPTKDVSMGDYWGHIHPDRIPLSTKNKRQAPHEVIDVDEWTPRVAELSPSGTLPTQTEDEQQDLRFLTGANRMVFGEDEALSRKRKNDTRVAERKKAQKHGHSSQKVSLYKMVRNDLKPSEGYVCDRCGVSGHLIHHCGTNLDPEFDTRPARDYICSICNQTGLHWRSLCPKNEDPNSITQQRRRAGIAADTSAERVQPLELDYEINTGTSKQSDTLRWGWEREHLRGLGIGRRSRSRSPIRSHQDKRVRDRFRPTYHDTSARRSISPRRGDGCGRSDFHARDPERLSTYGASYEGAQEARDRDFDAKAECSGSKSLPLARKGDREGRLSYYDEHEGDMDSPLIMRSNRRAPGQRQKSGAQRNTEPKPTQESIDFALELARREADEFLASWGRLELDHDSRAESVTSSSSLQVEPPSTAGSVSVAVSQRGMARREAQPQMMEGSSAVQGISVVEVMKSAEKERVSDSTVAPVPVEVGVSRKNLEGTGTYDEEVLRLFQNRDNVWVNHIKRNTAIQFLEPESCEERDDTALKRPVTYKLEGGQAHIDLTMA